MTPVRYTLLFVLACILMAACGDRPPPEQRVRDFIDRIEQLAEDREYGDLVGHIAGDYRDSRGNDKLKAAAYLRGFYLRNKSVNLFTRIDDIRFPEPGYASVTVYVALSRRPLSEAEGAALPRANMHRVVLELAEDGDSYEVLQSEWERASASNLLF